MISSLLVFQYGQARIWYAMSRDGLLPKLFSAVHPKYKTPYWSTWIACFAVGIPAGFVDIGSAADLANIGRCLPSCWFRWESFCCAAINRPQASVSRAVCAVVPATLGVVLRRTDVRADADYLAALCDLVGAGADNLHFL